MARLRLKRTEAAPLWGIPNSTLEPWEKSTSNAAGPLSAKDCADSEAHHSGASKGTILAAKEGLDAKGQRGYVHIDADEIRILRREILL